MTTTAPPPFAQRHPQGPAEHRQPPAAPARPPHRPSPPGGQAAPPRRAGDPLMLLPTLLGALAVLGGSTALLPLLDSPSWMLPLLEVVGVVWLAGVGGRLLTLPGWAVEILQFVALIVALTSLYTTTGIGGVLPGPAAISEGATMLHGAWEQILTTVPPAPNTPELGLLIALCVGGAAFLVDLLIAGAKVPALVALPLLTMYSVPASIDNQMLPWYAFVLPAALYVALLAVSGHHGQHLQSKARRSLSVSGAAIAAIAIVGSLLLADAITPIGTAGRLPHGTHGGDVGLNPWVSLRGDLNANNPRDALVVSGLDQPAYLRVFALEKWTADKGFDLGPVVADSTDIDGAALGAPAGSDGGTSVTITAKSYRAAYLPIFLGSTQVTGLTDEWNYDSELQTVFRRGPVTPGPYTVTADLATPTAAELETENVHSGGPLTQTGTLPAAVVQQARSVTAGARSPFEAAQDLLTYFTDPANGFTYSLTVPIGNSGSALLDFLELKQGYCEQYAAAMAIMLRAIGIPARVAVGFTQGTRQADGSYLVESTDAHAWVEVKFDKSGWVSFDPTPVVDGQGGLQGYQQDVTGPGADDTTSTTTPTGTATTAPTTTRSLQPGALAPGQLIPDADQGTAGATTGSASWGWLLTVILVLVAALVVAAIIALPALIRAGRRRRRLRIASSGQIGAGSAAWAEIEDTLVDHGIPVRPADSARVTANRLARAAHLSTSGMQDLRTVVTAAEREWYGAPEGTEPDLVPGVQAVLDGLERSTPRSWFDKLLPRSVRSRGRRPAAQRAKARRAAINTP